MKNKSISSSGKNTKKKTPQWVYFTGYFDLCFDNVRDMLCDAEQDHLSDRISDSCPSQWKECQDIHVYDDWDRGWKLAVPIAVYCRIKAAKAAQLADREVCAKLKKALDKMVSVLVTEPNWPSFARLRLKKASRVVLTHVTRLEEPAPDHAWYLEDILGYDLDDDDDEPIVAPIQATTPALSNQQ